MGMQETYSGPKPEDMGSLEPTLLAIIATYPKLTPLS